MNKTAIFLGLLIGAFSNSPCLAEQSGRPESLTLAGFQFGPENRWTFSHMREVLPTLNIQRDAERFLVLEQSDDIVSDFGDSYVHYGIGCVGGEPKWVTKS